MESGPSNGIHSCVFRIIFRHSFSPNAKLDSVPMPKRRKHSWMGANGTHSPEILTTISVSPTACQLSTRGFAS